MYSVGISLVRNEEDIIESFIRSNLEFLDGIFIFDNRSTDGTRDIIKALMHEGLPVCLSDDNDLAHIQAQKMTIFLHRIGSIVPVEFIVPLDADEFIECENRSVFQAALNSIPLDGVGLWKWKTYLLSPDELAQQEMKTTRPSQYKFFRNREIPQFSKAVIRIAQKKVTDLALTQGNHELVAPYFLQNAELKDISLAHFPVRSKTQIYIKAILGNLAYEIREKNTNKNRDMGFQKRNLYDRILNGENFSGIELCNIALNYAQVPGSFQWPENVLDANNILPDVENKYSNKEIRADILVGMLRSYHEYILGPAVWFDPTDTYSSTLEDSSPPIYSSAIEKDGDIKNISLDIPPLKYLYDRFSPESILDVGCDLCQRVRLFNNLGVHRTLGMDANKPGILFVPPENHVLHDSSMPIDLQEKFDLVICMETAGNSLPGAEGVLIANIERHAENLVLFSIAVPGQSGNVNSSTFSFWANQWAERGWAPMLFETLGFRALSTFSWLRRNSVLLSRTKNKIEALEKWEPFLQISEEEYVYYGQQPEIITDPLAQSFH